MFVDVRFVYLYVICCAFLLVASMRLVCYVYCFALLCVALLCFVWLLLCSFIPCACLLSLCCVFVIYFSFLSCIFSTFLVCSFLVQPLLFYVVVMTVFFHSLLCYVRSVCVRGFAYLSCSCMFWYVRVCSCHVFHCMLFSCMFLTFVPYCVCSFRFFSPCRISRVCVSFVVRFCSVLVFMFVALRFCYFC